MESRNKKRKKQERNKQNLPVTYIYITDMHACLCPAVCNKKN